MKTSVRFALAGLVQNVVGTIIAIALRLPYQFGGVGDPARVPEEFVSKGTALSAPPVAVVILIVAMVLAAQRAAVGRVGSALLAVLAVPAFVATVGETLGAGAFSGLTQVFVIVWSLVGAALIAGMFVSGVREALRRR